MGQQLCIVTYHIVYIHIIPQRGRYEYSSDILDVVSVVRVI